MNNTKTPNLKENIGRLAEFIEFRPDQVPEFPLDLVAPNSDVERPLTVSYNGDGGYVKHDNGDYIFIPLFPCKVEDQPEFILKTIIVSTQYVHHTMFGQVNKIDSNVLSQARSSFKEIMNQHKSSNSVYINKLSDIIVNKNIEVENDGINVIRLDTDSIYESYKDYIGPINELDDVLDVVILVGSRKDHSVACIRDDQFGCAVLDKYAMIGVLLK